MRAPAVLCCRGLNSSRKVLKADREKLRRDKLNEQFLELAGVLGELPSPLGQTCLAGAIFLLLGTSRHIRGIAPRNGEKSVTCWSILHCARE